MKCLEQDWDWMEFYCSGPYVYFDVLSTKTFTLLLWAFRLNLKAYCKVADTGYMLLQISISLGEEVEIFRAVLHSQTGICELHPWCDWIVRLGNCHTDFSACMCKPPSHMSAQHALWANRIYRCQSESWRKSSSSFAVSRIHGLSTKKSGVYNI